MIEGRRPETRLYFDYTLIEDGRSVRYGNAATDYSTDVLTGKVQAFISSAEDPFYIVFSPYASHGPWTSPPRYDRVQVGLPPPGPNVAEQDVTDKPSWVQQLPLPDVPGLQDALAQSYRTLLAVDDAVEALVEALKEADEWDETVLIFMTDNGYSFGEHRVVGKICVYEECARTPLLIRYPGATNRSEERLVQNIDIAPTVADIAGATPGLAVDGTSLVPLLEGTASAWRDSVLLHWKGIRASQIPGYWAVVTADGWKYAELVTGEVELYDLTTDPDELSNLAANPEFDGRQAELATKLAAKKREAGVP